MSRMQLMLDSASYNQELQQARQTLQAHGPSQPLPPGRLVGNQPPSWNSEMDSSLLDNQLAPVMPEMNSSFLDNQLVPALSQSSFNSSSDLREDHSPSFHESLSSRASISSARTTPSRTAEPFPGFDFRRIALLPSMKSHLLELQFLLPEPLLSWTLKHLQSLPTGSPSLGAHLSLPLLCCLQPLFQLLTILSLPLPMPTLLNLRGLNLSLHLNHFDLLVLPLL